METLKRDIGARIVNLDPSKHTLHKFGHIINYHIGKKYIPKRPTHKLTLTFAVGGAGAQSSIGEEILGSLSKKIREGKITVNLIAGVRPEVYRMFSGFVRKLKLTSHMGTGVNILGRKTKQEYFEAFSALLRTTDVLWTKPSELSFYAGLGIPIIMAPSVGSQEDFNRVWLKTIAAGITQNDPAYTDEWLFDWVESGWLARAALNGFVEAPILGTYNIERLVFHHGETLRMKEMEALPMAV
jgi:hypothetical protein